MDRRQIEETVAEVAAPKNREGLIELRARALARVENQRQLDEGVAWPVEFEKDEDGMEAGWKSWLPDAAATLEAEEAVGLAVVPTAATDDMMTATKRYTRAGVKGRGPWSESGVYAAMVAAGPYAKREA